MPSILAAAAAPGLPSMLTLEPQVSELARTTTALRMVAWTALDLDRPAADEHRHVLRSSLEAFVFLLVRVETLAEALECVLDATALNDPSADGATPVASSLRHV